MTLDDALSAAVARAVAPITAELSAVRTELAELRRSQPARLLSVDEAAAELHVSACTVRRRILDSTLPSRRIGSRVLVDMNAMQPASDAKIAAMARQARQP